MPAPKLRHYRMQPTAAQQGTFVVVAPAVPADRALVVSKITVATEATAGGVFYLLVGPPTAGGGGNNNRIAQRVTLAQGEVYTESGVVAVAGETVEAHITSTTASEVVGWNVQVFGEEVDN